MSATMPAPSLPNADDTTHAVACTPRATTAQIDAAESELQQTIERSRSIANFAGAVFVILLVGRGVAPIEFSPNATLAMAVMSLVAALTFSHFLSKRRGRTRELAALRLGRGYLPV